MPLSIRVLITSAALAGTESAEGVLLPAGRLIVADQVAKDHPQKAVLTTYIREYEAKYRQPISTFGGHAWDAAMLAVQAIRNAKSAEPAAIRSALEKIRGFQGTAGEFNFSPDDHNGLSEEAFVMVRITRGDWELLR